MDAGWLCLTVLDRERVLEANARIRRPAMLGLSIVAAASAAASPWLGWVPIATTLLAIAVGALAGGRVPSSPRPELVVLGTLAVDSGLVAVAAAASGGPQSPLLGLS